MKKGKIDVYEGTGSILESKDVLVELNNDEEEVILSTKNIFIATGSRPRTLPWLEVDGKYVMTSDEALEMEELAKINHHCWRRSYWNRMGIDAC